MSCPVAGVLGGVSHSEQGSGEGGHGDTGGGGGILQPGLMCSWITRF